MLISDVRTHFFCGRNRKKGTGSHNLHGLSINVKFLTDNFEIDVITKIYTIQTLGGQA